MMSFIECASWMKEIMRICALHLCRKAVELRWQRAFLVGARIALASAASWVAITLLFTFILGLLTDATRIGGGPVFLAIVSLPITTLLAGVGAAIVRMIVVKQIISSKEDRAEPELKD